MLTCMAMSSALLGGPSMEDPPEPNVFVTCPGNLDDWAYWWCPLNKHWCDPSFCDCLHCEEFFWQFCSEIALACRIETLPNACIVWDADCIEWYQPIFDIIYLQCLATFCEE